MKTRDRPTLDTHNTGRVKHDERGNAIWEWAIDPPKLSVADDAPITSHKVKPNPLGAVKGYSPYDSGILGGKKPRRKKDLKKLSEWVKLKQQFKNNQPGGK